MNIVSRGTVTTMEIKGSRSTKNVSPRVESNPVARKRRMDELPLSKIPKAPRRDSKDDECTVSSNSVSLKELTGTSSTDMLTDSHCAVNNREISSSAITTVDDDDDDEENLQKDSRDSIIVKNKPPIHPDIPHKRLISVNRRDDSTRLRKTIQWLEEGARKLREDLADARAELHEEKKSAKMARRDIERAVKKARNQEAKKYQNIIADLRARLTKNPFQVSLDNSTSLKSEQSKDDNQRCETLVARKRRAELNQTIENLNSDSSDSDDCTKRKRKYSNEAELRTIECEIRNSQMVNKELEQNLQMNLYKGNCEGETERLRELALEQQEVIEYLRQLLKEQERKIDQLLWSRRKKKGSPYKRWMELAPVAEVDDEEEQEDGDSTLSSTSSSVSMQASTIIWQGNTVTREAYEELLFENDELHMKYTEEQQELERARNLVRELEKALLQETHSGQHNRIALSNKLREAEEREADLIAELSELKEQNELLEFRVIELEEIGPRESRDAVDSGVGSPEPIQLFKVQSTASNKQKDRAIATVIPYSSCNSQSSLLLTSVQKSSLSLQESGIFEDEDDNENIEVTSCGTQTETPAGELLQEVQRLQVLRERIQEKAAKVPISTDTLEITEEKLNSYKEKVRELEGQLAEHQENHKKILNDNFIAKRKEEELINENRRLTTRIYWMENELRILREFKNIKKVNVGTMTKIDFKDSSTITESTISKEVSKTVKQVDMTWSRLEAKKAQLEKAHQELKEKNLCNQQLMERIAKLEKHGKNNTCDQVDGTDRLGKKTEFENCKSSGSEMKKFDELMEITDNENNTNRVSQIEFINYNGCNKMDVSESPLVISEHTPQNNKYEMQKVNDEREQNGMNYIVLYPEENPGTFDYERVSKNEADEKIIYFRWR
ncbi:janus kinase and microtubule-interacting protein 3-like isoform X3 [Cotesia glomerata]|uniref:janus kinase and microtubule-interacting protein 3-like isoform X3 n=1 Tax=Cotesia glomerata TaxID=32391 RepID=UPI001D00D97F|nr:janus kinase and microtubule-interacting protein 3-like isoform X3 [Cotesia glomerata]